MMTLSRIFVGISLLVLLVGSFSCKDVKPQPPERTRLDTLLVPPLSKLTIPVSFELQKVTDIVNEKLKGTFLKKGMMLNEKDSLYFELTSLSPIAFDWRAPDLRYTARLNVSAYYTKDVLGIKIRNDSPVDFEIEIQLRTELGFNADWSIRPSTTIESIVWKKDPILKLGIGELNFRKPVEKALLENQESLVTRLDGFIGEVVDTRKVIEKIWSDMQKPIRIKKNEPLLWLLVEEGTLKARWTRGPEGEITAQAELTGRIRTLLDTANLKSSPQPLPAFSYKTSPEDSLVASVLCTVPFDLLNKHLRQKLIGLSIDTIGYHVEVKKLEVYGTPEGLAIQMGLGGDIKGNIYFRGVPAIDPNTKSVMVSDFDFDVDSEDAILASADWFLHSSITSMVASHLQFELQPFVEMLPTLISEGIEKGKLGEKIALSIESWEVKPSRAVITSKNIQMVVEVRGMAGLVLKKLNTQSPDSVAVIQQE